MPIVRSVNIGQSKPAEWAEVGATSMEKLATPEPVTVGREGIVTDTQTDRRHHGITVSTLFKALSTDRSLLPSLIGIDGLGDKPRAAAERYVSRS